MPEPMSHHVEDLQRFGLKLFFEPDAQVDVRAFIPVFHRWIQTHALDELLIDVADYTHMSDGPSVLLAGHDGNYAIDRSEGRLGLFYYRKQPALGSLVERLSAVARAVLGAGSLLETDDSVGAACRFRGDEIQFVANDRLRAPVSGATVDALKPTLAAFGRTLFKEVDGGTLVTHGRPDRVRLNIRASTGTPLQSLLQNIS